MLTPAAVDTILGESALRAPFIRVIENGGDVPSARYTTATSAGNDRLTDVVDPEAVARYWDRGATLVLNALHKTQPTIARMSRDLGQELGAHVQANAYITPPGVKGLPAHYDTHDVIVLQIDGSKRWTIHNPVIDLPLPTQQGRDVTPSTADAPLIDTVLHAGDALYLPRGFVHAPETRDERSIHLTFGIQVITWADMLRDLVGTVVAEDAALRRAAPLHDPDSAAPQIREAAARLATLLNQLDQDTAGAGITKWRQRTTLSEPIPVLGRPDNAAALSAETPLRPRAGLRWHVTTGEQDVTVHTAHRKVKIPRALEAALRQALTEPTTAVQLMIDHPTATQDEILALLRHLLVNGLAVRA
ncbi:cupin domain-containing protein [Streptomyces sp. NPDC127178]|uniref:cupin domain-containing protein n=1 Tax=unclassified Streptomyces TaxID=2593676 RepID=UPI00362E6992